MAAEPPRSCWLHLPIWNLHLPGYMHLQYESFRSCLYLFTQTKSRFCQLRTQQYGAWHLPQQMMLKEHMPGDAIDDWPPQIRRGRESTALRRLKSLSGTVVPHAYGIAYLEVEQAAWTPVLVMQVLDGITLHDLALTSQPIGALSTPIEDCYKAISRNGVIHGDNKLDNLMLVKSSIHQKRILNRALLCAGTILLLAGCWSIGTLALSACVFATRYAMMYLCTDKRVVLIDFDCAEFLGGDEWLDQTQVLRQNLADARNTIYQLKRLSDQTQALHRVHDEMSYEAFIKKSQERQPAR